MHIRPATLDDVTMISALNRPLDVLPYDEWSLPEYIEHNIQEFSVAEEDRVIGAISTRQRSTEYYGRSSVPDTLNIITLAVDKDKRGNGVGKALVMHAIATAKERGCVSVLLGTRARYNAAGFYERLGFMPSKMYGTVEPYQFFELKITSSSSPCAR